jgi:tRNA pseudouridine55 synthase
VIHGIVVCDKPSGRSSHNVVAIARKAFDTRRVGHAGTLDPLASGVLVLAVNEGLKILRYLTLDDKRYVARIRLGSETDTLDAEGRVTLESPVPELTLSQVREAARSFLGTIAQRPPAISAIKQDGVALYKRARRGETVEPAERSVEVHGLEIDRVSADEIELRLHCGKGFYVRSLARDLGRALGTYGHLAALRRTQSGQFSIESCVAFERLVAASQGDEAARAELAGAALPIEIALSGAPKLLLDAEGEAHAQHGRLVPLVHVVRGAEAVLAQSLEPVLLCGSGAQPIALGRVTPEGLQIVRGLRW